MQSIRKRITRFLTLLFFAWFLQPPRTAWTEDRDFSRLVKEIESHFHAKRTHVPLFGTAKPLVRVAQPSGAKVLDIAIFEEQDFSASDNQEFAEVARKALGPDWHLMVQVVSHRDGEQTSIYVREHGNDYRLLIATLEPNEGVVLQVAMNPEDLLKLIDNPEEMGKAGKRISEEDESD
jgi:hypothetical protein